MCDLNGMPVSIAQINIRTGVVLHLLFATAIVQFEHHLDINVFQGRVH